MTLKALPTDGLAGLIAVMARWSATPGTTVNVALVPAARLSPLVTVAVIDTPLSALV